MTDPRLGFDSYTSEGDFYRDDSPEQQRIDEQRDFAFGGGLLKGITELPLDIMEFLSPEDEYNPGALAPDQSSPRQRIRTERLHGEQFYDELKSDPITKQAAEVGYGASMVVDPVLDTGILMAPHLLKGLNAIRKGEKPAIKLADLMTDEVGAIRAFHGTPHEVDKFSMDKIGTGEGAQAYGHGLYFAEAPETAKYYQMSTIPKEDIIIPQSFDQTFFDDFDVPMSDVRGSVKEILDREALNAGYIDEISDSESYMGRIATGIKNGKINRSGGSVYEVDLDVNPEDLLDWDLPLSEQSEKVQKAVLARIKETRPDLYEYHQKSKGLDDSGKSRLRKQMGINIFDTLDEGGAIYKAFGDEAAASKALSESGVKGIRYLDEGSRSAGEGSRNVVMFDEDLINIIGKDGKPTAAGAGVSDPSKLKGKTREEFLGSPKITTDENAADLVPKELNSVAKGEEQPFMGGYTIKKTPEGAAVYDHGEVIASYNRGDTLVVDPAYRGEGIGTELVYDYRTTYPDAKVAKERTKSAQAIQEKVWERIEGDLKKIEDDIDIGADN